MIASAVMFCLVVLLIIVTRKTDAVADTSVIINGKEYSQDNKMKILEIVSEDYYDELGPIIGNSSGSVKWDDIVAKATDKKVASNSDVQKNMDVYLQYVNGILLNGTNYNLCLEYKSGNSYNYYTTSNDAIQKVGTLDVDNIKLIFCKKDGNSYIPMTTKNGSKLRDAFSFFVFGDKGMEGFVDLVIKKPSEVTTKDIDDATIVYFSCKIHNAGILSAYNYLNGTNVSSTEKKWTLGDNDLPAETALYLYMVNATKGKAIMYNSADKGLGSDNKYSNIARICLTMSGIDRDQFVTDFAHTKEGISGGVTGKYYSGNVGYINNLETQVNGSDPVVWYTLDNGDKNYFSLSGQDAVNNYYIYSAGNVTYTSAGHSDMDKEGTDAEMELFVNTFVRAILAGNSAPQVSYTDAVYDDTQKAYSSYIKYNYTKFADRQLNFNFMISDADLIDGRGIINEAFMYVYNEEKRGDTDVKDGKFDSSKDKRLGYISIDGSGNVSLTSMPVSSGSSKVKSGVEYTVDNFWSLSGADDASLRQKLSDGTLKIGIQATDGHNGVGYAILNLQVKDLFNMD